MHVLNTCLRAALAGGALASAVLIASPAAHADNPATGKGAAAAKSMSEIASTLPKVSATDVLTLARSQVGISENANGGGTKFQQWYMSTPRARETLARDGGTLKGYLNAAWCDMFVSWVGQQLGIGPVMGSDAYTVEHARWFADHGRWGRTPKPGAVVFFNWNGSKDIDDVEHVGFVVKDNGDGTIRTIEGNTGDGGAVEARTRPTWQVAGYGYPMYPGDASASASASS
ncbi:CHAP domain-containing protein [Microbispora sp. H10830]|uniref:CHAP domain-containing protein n=1 Tax=Microbispora sp. H10830 TaxID=2729109 RepID=UPI0016049D6F|nr:CHAP domain-containing protein [Microbispora sp. H10830]